MDFIDYKIAAERHLETCLNLADKLSDFENTKQKRSVKQKEVEQHQFLLSNLYYLSGYMIECLYSYAICKYENNHVPIVGDLKTVLDNAPVSTYKICFSHRKRRALSVNYSIDRPQHRMTLSELSFFQTEGIVTTGSIPLMDSSSPLSNSNSQNLFINWSAYERYKINHFMSSNFPNFNYQNVVLYFWEIVEVCAQISQNIIREITLFLKAIKKKPTNI